MKTWQTIAEAYQAASAFLGDEFEAELLLRKLLGVDRAAFFISLHQPFPKEQIAHFQSWLQRRKASEPIQYILGEQEFYGRVFVVNTAVLIPRPETELLIELVLQHTDEKWPGKPLHVVDLGTGSGAIAITLAAERPDWQLTAIDLSPAALQVAKRNAERHGVVAQIDFRQGDFLLPLTEKSQQLDLIISNPPYIAADEMPELAAQVRDFEPALALTDGDDGLTAYRAILQQLGQIQVTDGYSIAFEIGTTQAQQVTSLIQQFDQSLHVTTYKDLAKHDRIILATHV